MAGTDRIDIADIDEIAPPFDLDEGAAAEPTPAPSITAENEFDIAALAAVDDFLATFGETVYYMAAGGGEREIKAIPIERSLPRGLDGMPKGSSPYSRWQVANDATKGIISSEIDDGKDGLKIAQRLGETPQRRPILRLLKHDCAWCEIEVR